MNDFLEIFSAFGAAWQMLGQFWWIVLPVAFYFGFFPLWMDFVVGGWLTKSAKESVMIEIIPPKNIEKGPRMMESVFYGIAGVFVTLNPIDQYVNGAVTHRFSFELVGEEGAVHFYIRMESKYKKLVEAQIYAQYPDAEIIEVEDYTKKFPIVIPNKEWNLWGTDMEFIMPDPYPIRTYDYFEESVSGEMVDPLSAVIEILGKLTPGQHIWLQYVIAPQPESWKKDEMKLVQKLAGRLKEDKGGIFKDLADVFSKIISGVFKAVEFPGKEKKEEQPLEFRLTPVEREVLKAVEDNLGKNAFLTKMRWLYLGKKDGFDKSFVSSFMGSLKQFNDMNLNSFKPQDVSKTFANYVFRKSILSHRQRKIYRRFKGRDMDGNKMTFSTKELATLYHFPDIGVKAPYFQRVDSKRSSAPSNLPIG